MDFVLDDDTARMDSDCLAPVEELDLADDGELSILEVVPAAS